MTRTIVTIIALIAVAGLFWALVSLGTPGDLGLASRHYVERGIVENRAANLVTSVVVNYRGLDTLGEVTVLFLSVTGAAFVLRRREWSARDRRPSPASEIVQTGARVLVAPIMLFGVYIFVHGHLTPGGGFQGGAVVASAVLLLLLADRQRALPHALMGWLESLSGFAFVLAGLAGLWAAGSFLANRGVLPLGQWNRLFSAGIIPVIYILVGLKVGSELAALLDVMMRGEAPAGTHGASRGRTSASKGRRR
jgi:multicomponent Na+:H+ antiporter subunit B